MKLLDLIKELDKPEKIYTDDFEGDDISGLTMQQKKALFKQGSLLLPTTDPSKPEVTSASTVIYTADFDKLRKSIFQNKKEIRKYKYHYKDEIKKLAIQMIKTYDQMYRDIEKLESLVELENKKP